MAVGDIIQVTFACGTATQIGLNVRHYLSATLIGVERTLLEIAVAMEAAVHDEYKPLLANPALFLGVKAQKIWPLPISGNIASTAQAGPGTGGASLLPKQVSGLIHFSTALGGRANQGRAYIPFPPEEESDADAVPTANYVLNLDLLATVLETAIPVTDGVNTETFVPGVYHRGSNTITPIINATARVAWATQRRRGSFGQPNIPIIE